MPRDIDSVADIVGCCVTIAEYVGGVTKQEFLAEGMRVGATTRELEIIGEATKRLSLQFREAHPEIEWGRFAGMRDVLIHAYDKVDVEEVWKAATRMRLNCWQS
jgi:uncharacterized protein with HEPN domain